MRPQFQRYAHTKIRKIMRDKNLATRSSVTLHGVPKYTSYLTTRRLSMNSKTIFLFNVPVRPHSALQDRQEIIKRSVWYWLELLLPVKHLLSKIICTITSVRKTLDRAIWTDMFALKNSERKNCSYKFLMARTKTVSLRTVKNSTALWTSFSFVSLNQTASHGVRSKNGRKRLFNNALMLLYSSFLRRTILERTILTLSLLKCLKRKRSSLT